MPTSLITITVNYRLADDILAGMDEVVRQHDEIGDAEFWIVDNDSGDGSVETLRRGIEAKGVADRVRVIASPRNAGFGAGNNVAIREALQLDHPPEFLYFLNPDAVPKPGAIAALKALLIDKPDAGAVGGLLCDDTGHRQSSMFRFPQFQSEIERAFQFSLVTKALERHLLPIDDPAEPVSVDWLSGASFMTRRQVFETAGLFDEDFFLYWEEVELFHRIKKAGYTVFGTPDAVVFHEGGASTGMNDGLKRLPKFWYQSRNHFFHKTGRGGNVMVLNWLVLLAIAGRRAKQLLLGKTVNEPSHLRDFFHYCILNRG